MDIDHDVGEISGNLTIIDPGPNTLKILGTSGIQLPSGTSAQRDSSNGVLRFNTDTNSVEALSGNSWVTLTNSVTSSGTVTSVGLTVPETVYIVSNSPITTSGNIALTLKTQNAHTVFTGPTVGAASPTFRTVSLSEGILSDVVVTSPTVNQVLKYNGTSWVNSADSVNSGTVTSVGLTVPETIYTVSNSPVTTSGNIALSLKTQANNTVLAGPTTGNATPTFRSLSLAQHDMSDVTTTTPTTGQVLYYNGSQWINNSPKNFISLNDLLGITISGAQAGESLYYTGTQWINYGVPGGTNGGGAAKRIWSNNISAQTGTSSITPGTSVPLVTDGSQLWSITLTPYSTLATYVIQTSIMAAARTNNSVLTLALFRGSTFIGATAQTVNSSNNSATLTLNITDIPATTSAVTYQVRIGVSSSVWYVNRRSNEVTYGGMRNGWTMWEY